MIELSLGFGFEAAHSLRRAIDAEPSLRIHGHSYRGELILRGRATQEDGMLIDLGVVERVTAELRERLDHRLLDEVPGLGPGTMEHLARWIFRFAKPSLPLLAGVSVSRPSLLQRCTYTPDADEAASSSDAP